MGNLRLFVGMLILWVILLIPIDRYFFKKNASFSIRFLYSCMPNRPEWNLPILTSEQDRELNTILSQEFTYFAKGTHCYAFMSQDRKYIIKFHRYPSHMRIFPWLNHPFAYIFDKKRMRTKEYNLKRYDYFMSNYKSSFENLREETGVFLLHINRTDHLKKMVTLVDKTANRYRVSLDDVTFILQKRADLIYPTLEQFLARKEKHKAEEAISHILNLIVQSCQKGYVNKDPVLKRNYGLLEHCAMYIDIGDLMQSNEIKRPENYIPHVKEVTADLRAWIAQNHPELMDHYDKFILCLKNP